MSGLRHQRLINGRYCKNQTNWSKTWLKPKEKLFNVSAPWWTWVSARPDAEDL